MPPEYKKWVAWIPQIEIMYVMIDHRNRGEYTSALYHFTYIVLRLCSGQTHIDMFCFQSTISRVLWSMTSMRSVRGVLIFLALTHRCWYLEVMMARSVCWRLFQLAIYYIVRWMCALLSLHSL